MEEKKTDKANLENRRTRRLLLGLVVTLATCLVALELTSHPDDDSAFDEEMLEEIAQDLEQLPAMEKEDLFAAVDPNPAPVQSQLVNEVKAVNDEASSQAEDTPVAAQSELAPVEVPPSMEYDPASVPAMPLDVNDNPLNLRVVEDAPKPVMGWSPFMQWLTKTLKYPPTARKQNIQGTVLINFVVNADGTVSDIKVAKGCDATLDREALRVAKMMPKWEAGIRNGKPARTMVGIPVVFKL